MSILQFPRVYFRGNISWDPVTTNNYEKHKRPAAYDESDADAVLNAERITANKVSAFREAAVDMIQTGSWNPHGTYRSPFFQTVVSGTDRGAGLDLNDPVVGAPVSFTGMLVDSEPYGAFSSQLFFDDMSFGIGGGCRIYGKRAFRFTDRYLNFAANPLNDKIAGRATVMWQTCFPKNMGLEIDAFDSETLTMLEGALSDDNVHGIMVRFVTYRTIYYDDPDLSDTSKSTQYARMALRAMIKEGGFQPNPAQSKLVGTVGLWSRGDCILEPADRFFAPANVPIPVGQGTNQTMAACGTAFARANKGILSVDFSNCLPAADRAALSKPDLGDLLIMASPSDNPRDTTQIGRIPSSAYTQDAFDKTSGIIDIPVSADVLDSMS